MKKCCALVLADSASLITLAYAESLDLLLTVNIPIFISDMVIYELESTGCNAVNEKSLTFIKKYLGNKMSEIKTGVPDVAEDLKKLKVDPGDESIRRIIDEYENKLEGEYALLISEENKFIGISDLLVQTHMITTRLFLKELESRNIIKNSEKLMHKAENNSIIQ